MRRTGLVGGPSAVWLILSRQEQEVLEWILEGLTLKEVGVAMGVGTGTVRGYRMTLFRKLGAKTLVQVVRRGLECGLLRVTTVRAEWP